jgi:ribonuclease BN (tRNA processing enzyme)
LNKPWTRCALDVSVRSVQVFAVSDSTIQNLRVHLYGTQGSGSVFPSRAERMAIQRRGEHELLTRVFADIARHANGSGRLNCSVEELIGGPLTPRAITGYAERFNVPEPRVYGGWTTCVRIETADGHDIVLDCGSGFRNCARDLQAKWADRAERHLHILGSHSHLDHTEGFDQAAVCFDPRNHLHIYGNRQFLRALDYNLGIFSRQVARAAQGVQTPIFFGIMPAKFTACEIGSGQAGEDDGASLNSVALNVGAPIQLGETRITAFEVFHPAPCLAYRIERGGRVFVFCTDHELQHGAPDDPNVRKSLEAEARLIAHATGADLMYRDGQYLRAEYDGLKGVGESGAIPRNGWGHSCFEDVIDMAQKSGIRKTLIGHHDPNREWSERNWMDESLARRSASEGFHVELARAETVFDL